MDRSNYSFLDYTVMPFLRKKVISSDAAVLFSEDFSKVLWANAIGTKLFGGSNVIDLLETGLSQSHPLVRQFKNAARQIEEGEPVVRNFQISRGLKTDSIRGELSIIILPNGERTVLLSCPAEDLQHRYREHELAAMSVESLDGFADAAAIIDEYGLILASSRQFDAFEIDPATLETLVSMVAREDDRLVKRPIKAGDGETIATGLGRIRDLPARFLVVLASTEEDDDSVENPESSAIFEQAMTDIEVDSDETGEPDADDQSTVLPPWMSVPDEVDRGNGQEKLPIDDEEPAVPIGDDSKSVEESIAEITRDAEDGSLLDRWYFDKSGKTGSDTSGNDDIASGQHEDLRNHEVADNREIDINDGGSHTSRATSTGTGAIETAAAGDAAPARFAFTIDSDRIIQSVSSELVEAVGPVSGNIAGQTWAAMAEARGIDENGVINALLAKADTWSGRSVLWPVDNTDMAVPIDLAALPVFGKERNFEGFRGFGIIRAADAVVDPTGKGLAIVLGGGEKRQSTSGEPSEEIQSDHQSEDRQVPDEDGFVGWRSNIDEEDETGSTTRMNDVAEDNGLNDAEETIGGAKAETDDAQKDVPDNEPGNVFHLPNYRTDKKTGDRERREDVHEALFSTPSDFGGGEEDIVSRAGHSEHGDASVPELNGREKRAFGEIRRSLAKDAEVPAREDASGSETGMHFESTSKENLPGSEQSVLGSLPIPLLVYQTSKTLFANDALLEQTGYTSVDELAAAGGVDALLASEDGEAGSAIRLKNGKLMPVHSRLTKVDWQGESALCLTFEQQDETTRETISLSARPVVSDEKAALDMVRVSELENILETATDGLLIINPDGMIESLNTSGEALFGRSQAEVSGKPFTSLFASESRNVLENHLEDLKAQGETSFANHGQEVIGVEASGGFIPLFAMIGKVGSSGRFCAVLRDLTDWKKTEEELVEAKRKAETANDQKSEFLSRVSHEIREPLTSIIGFSDVMIEERFGAVENERYREYLRDINRSGIHVLDLVNDLLDISKIEAGKLELSYEAVDLNQLASETVALLQPKANNKRIIIRTSLSRAVPKVVADARSIRQIILNLVSNAIQHSNRNSQVIVSTTYEENGEVALRIRDTGSGMNEAELTRALEPFAQVGEDRMESPSGTGLGLPLTKALVEANRAYFELESEKGEGTIAHIQFPSQRVLAD